jgi:uncharacterized membrane protein
MYELKIKDGEIKGFKTAAGKKFEADLRKHFEKELKKNKVQEYEITIVSNGKRQARIRVLGTVCLNTAVAPKKHNRKECKTLRPGLVWCP